MVPLYFSTSNRLHQPANILHNSTESSASDQVCSWAQKSAWFTDCNGQEPQSWSCPIGLYRMVIYLNYNSTFLIIMCALLKLQYSLLNRDILKN